MTEDKTGRAMPKPPPTQPAAAASVSPTELGMAYLVKALLKYNASDLHIRIGRPPLFRINGKLVPAKMQELSPQDADRIVLSVMNEKQRRDLQEKRQVDLTFSLPGLGRFRSNVYYHRGGVSAAVRVIPMVLRTVEELGIPQIIRELAHRPRGLLLITGSTGAGKSTTMSALVQYINETSPVHVLCLEDPIEYVYKDQKATITQREVGADIHSMRDGLYAGLRQDPDIIVLGELRDADLIQMALTAAETGHLVISTLHTNDSVSTLDRILDTFSGDMQNQVRIQLASVLVGVVSQQLVLRADGHGRVPACEVMIKSPAIENYILQGETGRIAEAIASSNDYYQMQSMNQALERLVKAGTITEEEALRSTANPSDLKLRLQGLTRDQGYEMASSFHSKAG